MRISDWSSDVCSSDLTEELVESRVIALPDRTSLSLPVGWGRYRLEIADPQTGQVARSRFYAGWGAQDAEAVGNRPDRVPMELDGGPAKPGGNVQMTIPTPHDRQARATVAGKRLL